MTVSVGVNVADNSWVPAFGVVPPAGLYAIVPGMLPLALSCVAERVVPYVIALGVAHVTVGVALPTTKDTVPVAVL